MLVASNDYGLALYRYILRNPLEAGLVTDPLDYPWSSAQAVLSDRLEPWWDFTHLHAQLAGQGDRATALAKFLSIEERAPVALQGRIYGTDQDLERLDSKPTAEEIDPEDLPQKPIAAYALPGEKTWISMGRAVQEGKHRPTSVARYYKVHTSTATRAAERFVEREHE